MVAAANVPLLQMEGIAKSFPGVRALIDAKLTLHAGEVVALLGENGAGKSTLIKVLSGAHRPDAGRIRIDGEEVMIRSPQHAQRLGISVIYQEFNLVPTLTVRENLFLGREDSRGGFFLKRDECRRARELFQRLRVDIHPEAICRSLPVAKQQMVEIAKALAQEARIIVMDEPTAALTDREVESLFAVIRDLQTHGIGIIYVSHRLAEVFQICDRAVVMRDGRHVATENVADLNRQRLIELMVGRKLEAEFPKRATKVGAERLVVRGLSRGRAVRDVSLDVRRGEIVALTGLVGSGRTEVARMLFGADRPDRGHISVDGRELRLRSPRDAIRSGVCMLTEDRKTQGLVLALSVRENFGLPNLPRLSLAGFVRRKLERLHLSHFVRSLGIRVANTEQPVRNLSGGNQQKVVLAKWLEANSQVLLIDEPTRGIDVAAKYGIYCLMNDLAAAGIAILMISSELPEVLGMSDRILVMHEGRITGEITDVASATQEQVLALAMR